MSYELYKIEGNDFLEQMKCRGYVVLPIGTTVLLGYMVEGAPSCVVSGCEIVLTEPLNAIPMVVRYRGGEVYFSELFLTSEEHMEQVELCRRGIDRDNRQRFSQDVMRENELARELNIGFLDKYNINQTIGEDLPNGLVLFLV